MISKNYHQSANQTPMVLDPATKVPLYQQIFVILRDKITSGDLSAGDPVMGEQEVCDTFAVSRITTRRALNELASSGLVERQRGCGTRVLGQGGPASLVASIDGLLENVGHIGRTTTVEVLSSGPEPLGREAAQALGLEKGDSALKAVRVRHLGEEPMSHLVTWVPKDIGARIAGQDMSQTPLLLLLEAAGVAVAAARQTITATLADATVARALNVPAGAPLIEVRRVVSDRDGRAVEYIKIR